MAESDRKLITLLLLAVLTGLGIAAAAQTPPGTPAADRLHLALQKALDYCRRLDRTAMNFIYKEEVQEEANRMLSPSGPPISIAAPSVLTGDRLSSFRPGREKDFPKTLSLFDCRLAGKGSEIKENRSLLEKEKDGEPVSPTDTSPENWHFRFRDILFAPSLILGEGTALKYEYSLAGEGKIQGDPIVVVACAARPEYEAKALWGRASVRLKDGAVLRIDWAPESLASHGEALDIAKQYHVTPKIQAYTEFGVEKHGVLFPSFDFNEETYVTRDKATFVRSRTAATYKAYVFYTVETESGNK